MLKKDLINYQDKLYWIYRRLKQSSVREENVQIIKDFWYCDLVLKFRNNEDDSLLFLREIPDVEVLN
jgi:hypothetical protein